MTARTICERGAQRRTTHGGATNNQNSVAAPQIDVTTMLGKPRSNPNGPKSRTIPKRSTAPTNSNQRLPANPTSLAHS
jgi:hypothetical protein